MKLYVDMIDVSPLIYENEAPSHRIVEIELTREQKEKLIPKIVANNMNGEPVYERIKPISIQEVLNEQPDER